MYNAVRFYDERGIAAFLVLICIPNDLQGFSFCYDTAIGKILVRGTARTYTLKVIAFEGTRRETGQLRIEQQLLFHNESERYATPRDSIAVNVNTRRLVMQSVISNIP